VFKTTETQWLWTSLSETMHPDRKAGEPVYEHYRNTVPLSWYEKGYVKEDEGQIDLFDIIGA
jgi:hypothetical protein